MKSDRTQQRNIVLIIKDRFNGLTKTNRKIAEYILRNLATAAYLSISEISSQIGVSDASIVRFAQEIGFKGYQALREELAANIHQILYPSEISIGPVEKSSHPVLDLTRQRDMEYIDRTMTNIDPENFTRLIDRIDSARRIYSVGWGVSSILASYMTGGLQMFYYDAVAVQREHRPMVQQLFRAERDDLVVVFDLIVYSAEVLEAVEYLHRKDPRIPIVSFTSEPAAPVVHYAELNFYCDLLSHAFKSMSLTAPMSFINAVIEQLAVKNPGRYKKMVEDFKREIYSSPLHFAYQVSKDGETSR